MTLDISCIRYVGQQLYIKPHYGWGWDGLDLLPLDQQKDGVPLPFHIKLCLLLSWRDDVRGGVISGGLGIVEEPDHFCNNFWIVFQTRLHKGNFKGDLTETIMTYDIDLGVEEARMFRGYGQIAETPEQIQYYEDNWQKLHPPVPRFVDHELRERIITLLDEFNMSGAGANLV